MSGAERCGASAAGPSLSSRAPMMPPSGDLLGVARALATDHVTATLDRELRAVGVRPILIKGASLATWLYGDGTSRPYVDADVLVDPALVQAAEDVLRANGFTSPKEEWGGDYELHARPWTRTADNAAVDLHRTLPGLREVSPDRAWRVLDRRREHLELGGGVVDVLDVPARLLLLALHLTHHTLHYPADVSKPREDLRRAIDQVPESAWREALALADELEATARFTAGLRQGEGGDGLADRIGAPPAVLLDALRPGSAAPMALGFDRLAGARGWAERARIVRQELLPSPGYVRFTSYRARTGPAGLVQEYLHRLGGVARYALPSYLAWRRARRP